MVLASHQQENINREISKFFPVPKWQCIFGNAQLKNPLTFLCIQDYMLNYCIRHLTLPLLQQSGLPDRSF